MNLAICKLCINGKVMVKEQVPRDNAQAQDSVWMSCFEDCSWVFSQMKPSILLVSQTPAQASNGGDAHRNRVVGP